MRKLLLLKFLLLLCMLITGGGKTWGDEAIFDWTTTGNMGSNATGKVNNVTLTGAKNSASGTPAVTSNTLRLYAYRSSGDGSSAIFTSDVGYIISAIEVTSSNGGTILKYATDDENTFNSFSFSKGVATVSGLNVSSITLKNCQNSGNSNTTIQVSKVIITYSSISSDPSSDVSFAYSARSLDLNDASSFTQAATTTEGYSETVGASVIYTMTANTAGATINESTGEVTPMQAGSVTVQASAAAIEGKFAASTASYTLTVTDTRVFTVTCHIGNSSSDVNRLSGATLGLDNPSALGGMSFAGWSSTSDVSNPTWVANTTKVTGNMELYAVYEAVAGEYSYHLVEADQDDWRGQYLIAYSDTKFANGKASGTSGIGSKSTVVSPTSSNLSDNKVTSTWGDQYYVTFESIDDADLDKGYLLKTQDGYYNYHTSDANGINGTSANKSTAASYPITIDFSSESEINITLDKGQVFRYNASGEYFRFYKSSSYSTQGKVYLYKRTTDVEPVYSLGIESVTISSAKYATYCSTKKLNYSGTGVKAYAAKSDGTKVMLTEIEDGVVPAGEGVVLFSETADTYAIPVTEEDATDYEALDNELIGITIRTKVAYDGEGSKKNYVLSNEDSGVGFYKASANGAYLPANRAYLSTAAVGVGGRFLGFEDVTGIGDAARQNVKMIKDNDVYDLQGRRVGSAEAHAPLNKGLYILNGKKVVIR